MHPFSFMKNPLYAIIAIVIVLIFFFVPILLVVGIAIFALYDWVNTKTKEKPEEFPLKSTPKVYKASDFLNQFGNKHMSSADKQAYLSSPKWKALRQQVLARDNHKCVVSGRTDNLHIHHISYENLGDELLSDLVTLHADVHDHLHQLLGYDRNEIYSLDRYYAAINHSTGRKDYPSSTRSNRYAPKQLPTSYPNINQQNARN